MLAIELIRVLAGIVIFILELIITEQAIYLKSQDNPTLMEIIGILLQFNK